VVDEQPQLRDADYAKDETEDVALCGGQAGISDGPQARAAHQPIAVTLPGLVERRGAAGDQRRADQRVNQPDERG
jgi:hypothetical protein